MRVGAFIYEKKPWLSSSTLMASGSSFLSSPSSLAKGILSSLFAHPLRHFAQTSGLPQELAFGGLPPHPKTTLSADAMNRAQFTIFFKQKCEMVDFTMDEALRHFDCMISIQPAPPTSSFCLLLGALAKKKHYFAAISLRRKLELTGLLSDCFVLKILLSCFCNKRLKINGSGEGWAWRGEAEGGQRGCGRELSR